MSNDPFNMAKRRQAPALVSPEARSYYNELPDEMLQVPDIADPDGLKAIRQVADEMFGMFNDLTGIDYRFADEETGGVPCVWIKTPESTDDMHLILHMHGGGYVLGSPRSGASVMVQLAAATRRSVLSIGYRRAPEHPFPAAIDDVLAVYRGLLSAGKDGNQIVFAGESAGGGLALAVALAVRDQGLPLPGAIIALSPWADLARKSDTYDTLADVDPVITWEINLGVLAAAYVGKADPQDPLISPVYGDFHGLPPILIQTGSREVLLGDAFRVARAARKAGVDVQMDTWDGLWHVFQQDPRLPETREAIAEMAAFVDDKLL